MQVDLHAADIDETVFQCPILHPRDCRCLTVEEQAGAVRIDSPRPWPDVGVGLDCSATLGSRDRDQQGGWQMITLFCLPQSDQAKFALTFGPD
jgi:hypothetical protein